MELERVFLAARAEIEQGGYDFGNSDDEPSIEVNLLYISIISYHTV